MKLCVTRCRIIKIIQTVSRRTGHSRVGCPSSGPKTTRVHVSARRFKHLFTRIRVCTSQFETHFKFVQPQGDDKFSKKHKPIYCWIYQKCSNQQSKNNQYKSMAPNKFESFHASIKGILDFMYCCNLHYIFVFFLHTLILTPKFLRSHVFLKDYGEISMYSGTNIIVENHV